jgi:threonine dehydrogenase-like Zn-dependent dehydrogenase
MKASFLVGPMKSEVRDVPIPEIGDDDILMRLEYVGVCASELHPWKRGVGGVNGIMGHEPVGYAAKIGKNVAHIREGERVTALGQSCFAEYARIPACRAVPVPDAVPSKEALGEPLSCLVSAAERTPVCLGDSCAVVGLGYMGLVMTDLIALKGAGRIFGIDVRPECEGMALRHGIDVFLTPDRVPESMKLTKWADMDLNYGLDVVCEVTGNASALKLAAEMAHQHGVLNIVGYHQDGPRIVDMELWNWKALTVINGHERREGFQVDCMKRALGLIAAGKLQLERLVTHEFPIDAVDEAFKALISKPHGYIKGVISL